MQLSQLQKAFEPLTKLSRAEAKVEVAGVDVYLRLLSPDEELECQQESQSHISDLDGEDVVEDIARTKAIQFLDAFRMGVLSRAIVQIGDNDLREVSVIETGDFLDNGVPVKVTKVQAVRTILEGFPRSIQVRLMQEFHILTESVSQVVEKAIVGEFSSSEAEIKDLESRIEEIKSSESVKSGALDEDIRKTMRTAQSVSDGFVDQRKETAKDIESQQKTKQENIIDQTENIEESEQFNEQEEAPKVRQPIRPEYAPPPQQNIETSPEPPPIEEKDKNLPPNIYQEQEMPKRTKPKPQGLKEGVEVYRLPPSEVGGSITQTQREAPAKSSRNPRFRTPNK